MTTTIKCGIIVLRKGGEKVKKPNEKELLKLLDTVEKLLIRIISIVGWVRILIDVLGK